METSNQIKTALIGVLMLLAVNLINAQALSGSITSQTNASCFGSCDGSLTATATGGSGSYTYMWSPTGGTAPTTSGLCAGSYICTIDDGVTTFTVSATVTEPSQLTASVSSSTNASCNGICDGTASLTVSGGSGPYSFQWSNGANGNPTNGLCAGTYSCTVTDANACVSTVTVTITQPPPLNVSAGSNQTICSGTSMSICGSGAITYNWSPPNGLSSTTATCPVASPTTTTTYTLTGTDMNGCVGTATVTLTVSPVPTISVSAHTEPSCAGSNGSITVTGTAFVLPMTFELAAPFTQNTTGIFSNLTASTYSLVVVDAVGCSAYMSYQLLDSCEVVWPGDADNDLVANNNDILDIGLYYGSTGWSRANANLSWTAQPAPFWTNTKANGYNEKHDDCNGDGMIDASDTTAVIQNYSLVHPPYKLMSVNMTGTPLTVDIVQDTVSNSGTANIKVSLGTAASPAANIYGIALTLSIDTTIVAKDSTTMDVSNSWIAAGSTPFLNNVIENYPNGEIDIALCRTNHTNISGYGEVADLSVTMKDDISGKIMSGVTKTLNVNISKVKIISANGDTVSFSASGDSLVVDQVTTFIANAKTSSMVKLFPNPANEFATIHSTGKDLVKYEVYSLQGMKIDEMNNEALTSEITINTKSFEKGIYLVKAYTLYNVKVFRLQVN